MSLRRETSRLRRAFGAIVLAVSPMATAEACSDDVSVAEPARLDATTHDDVNDDVNIDVAVSDDADADASAPIPFDAACQVITEMLDAGPDVDSPCRYTLPCGLVPDESFVVRGCDLYLRAPDDGGDASLGCSVPAADGCHDGAYVAPGSGSFSFECVDCLGGTGRRPNGLRRTASPTARSAEGAYFARAAHDEAASVIAFARMHRELQRFGAPAELVAGAARSMEDELRHARAMSRMARRHGAMTTAARARRLGPRSLELMARENVVEGCVRETYGALLMHWQAAHARGPALRRVFARIAVDETRHAALSWQVAKWAEAMLDAPARARVASAQRRALRTLAESTRTAPALDFDVAVGRPGRAASTALLDRMIAQLT